MIMLIAGSLKWNIDEWTNDGFRHLNKFNTKCGSRKIVGFSSHSILGEAN